MKTQNRKYLLLQFRDLEMEIKEQEIILNLAKKPDSEFEFHNFFKEDLSQLDVTQYSHIIIGGGSNYNLSKTAKPWFADVVRIVLEAAKHSIPVLGLCYGMQFIALAFGAKVVADPDQAGVGPEEVFTQNTQGSFFEFLPKSFASNMIHKDSVINLPAELVCYGYTQKCQNTLIAHRNKPIYGTQFHSEITKPYVKFALQFYQGKYTRPSENQKIVDSIIEPSGRVAEIIPRFLEL